MKRLADIMIVVGVALCAAGCHTPREEAKWYAMRHPIEASNYEFERASLEPLKIIEESSMAVMQGFLQGVERRIGDPGELEGYVRRTRVKLDKIRESTQKEYEAIESLLKVGGQLYFYRRQDSRGDQATGVQVISREVGLVVIRDGEIVYRQMFYGSEVHMHGPLKGCEEKGERFAEVNGD